MLSFYPQYTFTKVSKLRGSHPVIRTVGFCARSIIIRTWRCSSTGNRYQLLLFMMMRTRSIYGWLKCCLFQSHSFGFVYSYGNLNYSSQKTNGKKFHKHRSYQSVQWIPGLLNICVFFKLEILLSQYECVLTINKQNIPKHNVRPSALTSTKNITK